MAKIYTILVEKKMAYFQFVGNFGGQYIPLQQAGFKETYEKLTERPFDGACAGAVAYMLEKLVEPPFVHTHRFHQPVSTIRPALSPEEVAVHYQIAYEQSSNHFFTRFIRGLRISKTGYPDAEYYCEDNSQFIQILGETNENQVSLVTLQYRFNTAEKTLQQAHMITLIKQNGKYICYDPNLGLAIFNRLAHLKEWLAAEMKSGALQHFTHEVKQKMIVLSPNGQPSIQEGLLKVSSVFVESFTYPARPSADKEFVPQQEAGKKIARL